MVSKWGVICYTRGQRKDFYEPLPLAEAEAVVAERRAVLDHTYPNAWHAVRKACRLNWLYNGWKPIFRLPSGELVDVFDFGLDSDDE